MSAVIPARPPLNAVLICPQILVKNSGIFWKLTTINPMVLPIAVPTMLNSSAPTITIVPIIAANAIPKLLPFAVAVCSCWLVAWNGVNKPEIASFAQLKAEMLRFKGKRKLTQEMVDLFVAQVRIYENKNLEIVLNYEDELKKFAELNMEREAG